MISLTDSVFGAPGVASNVFVVYICFFPLFLCVGPVYSTLHNLKYVIIRFNQIGNGLLLNVILQSVCLN